ncbi:MAG: DEAD/DEAH box helicase, partial [Acidimicrobiales bacterium]
LAGGAVLRHALGLEGSVWGGPVSVVGSGWAADLVTRATTTPPEPLDGPDGFVGRLRDYQAAARGWLAFLDDAGLGGCLAMDMGLGKTPTLLAHILATKDRGPTLVVAPPAVLGNWAAEAARFTPGLRVVVHHGPERDGAAGLEAAAAGADLVLTTYGTGVRDVDGLAAVGWDRLVVDEAQAIKNPASETAQTLRRIPARSRLALTGTPVENGLSDLWAILDFTNPGLVGPRTAFVEQLGAARDGRAPAAEAPSEGGISPAGGPPAGPPAGPLAGPPQVGTGEGALRALNGLLVFRRTKAEPAIAAELPDKIDELDHCAMTPEQIGLYQAILDRLLSADADEDRKGRQIQILAAITALKQVCNHPAAYLTDDRGPLAGRSGKLERLEEIVDNVMEAGERVLVFTHFARWAERLAGHLGARIGQPVACYHGGLTRAVRDRMIEEFQEGRGPGVLVLSLKAGGAGLNLTAANHVVLYDRWWNPAVEDQARDRVWRIGQSRGVVSHRLVCPGTVDERVEEVVAGKRRIADLVLPRSSSLGDLEPEQLRTALGLGPGTLALDAGDEASPADEETAA